MKKMQVSTTPVINETLRQLIDDRGASEIDISRALLEAEKAKAPVTITVATVDGQLTVLDDIRTFERCDPETAIEYRDLGQMTMEQAMEFVCMKHLSCIHVSYVRLELVDMLKEAWQRMGEAKMKHICSDKVGMPENNKPVDVRKWRASVSKTSEGTVSAYDYIKDAIAAKLVAAEAVKQLRLGQLRIHTVAAQIRNSSKKPEERSPSQSCVNHTITMANDSDGEQNPDEQNLNQSEVGQAIAKAGKAVACVGGSHLATVEETMIRVMQITKDIDEVLERLAPKAKKEVAVIRKGLQELFKHSQILADLVVNANEASSAEKEGKN